MRILLLLLSSAACGAELSVSTDAGESWSARDPKGFSVRQIVPDPAHPSAAWVLAMPAFAKPGEDLRFASPAILRTGDLGKTWQTVDSFQGPDPYCIAVDPLTPGTVYVGCAFGRIQKSADGGNAWSLINLRDSCRRPDGTAAHLQSGVYLIHARGNMLLASGHFSGFVAVSDDAGASWTLTRSEGFEACAFSGDTILAITGSGAAVRSGDQGKTWGKRHEGD